MLTCKSDVMLCNNESLISNKDNSEQPKNYELSALHHSKLNRKLWNIVWKQSANAIVQLCNCFISTIEGPFSPCETLLLLFLVMRALFSMWGAFLSITGDFLGLTTTASPSSRNFLRTPMFATKTIAELGLARFSDNSQLVNQHID